MRVCVTRTDFSPFVSALQHLDTKTQRNLAAKGFELLLEKFNGDPDIQSVCLVLVGEDAILEADDPEDLLLHEADFPQGFKNMAHPDDFNLVSAPFVEYIPHEKQGHNRIIVPPDVIRL